MNIQAELVVHISDLGDDPDFPIPATVTQGSVSWLTGGDGSWTQVDRQTFDRIVEAVREYDRRAEQLEAN